MALGPSGRSRVTCAAVQPVNDSTLPALFASSMSRFRPPMRPDASASLLPILVFAIVLACVFRCASVSAQGVEVVRELERSPDDTAKVLRLSDLCYEYRRKDVDSALWFGGRALDLARKLRFPKGEAQALNDLAIIHIDRSAYAEADSALRSALRIRRGLGDEEGVGAVHNKLGNLYQVQLRLDEALEENRQALAIFERLGQRSKEALILSNIAILNFNLRQYEQALKDHEAAAAVHQALGNGPGLATSQGNMANVLLALGDTTKALDLFQRAGSYFKEHDLLREYAVQAHNEAGVQLALGDAAGAIRLYSEALAIREKGADRKASASSMTGLADASLSLGRVAEARRMAHRSLTLASSVGATSEVMQAYKLLARIHARAGNADSTLIHHERYTVLRDSVFSADMSARIADLQTRIGMERKEHELQQQRADLNEKNLEIADLDRRAERRNFLLALAIGGSGVLLLASLAMLQRQKRRAGAAKDAAVIAEREQGLKVLVQSTDAERKRIAGELHDGVGQQLTALKYRIQAVADDDARLKDALDLADEAGREVRGIAHRMMPRALDGSGLVPVLAEMLRKSLDIPGMSHVFEHHGMEQRLPADVETGVYRIAQEVVNNILKHARAHRVEVQLLRNKGAVVMIVEDDGVGIDPSRAANGLGLRGSRDRARILKGSIDLSSREGKGTVVTLRVPVPETSTT